MPGRNRPAQFGTSTRWGFHRLDPRWAERLVDEAGICSGDLVLDIGAGDGVLVAPLIDRGARVVAIELHPRRAQGLRQRFAAAPVKVVCVDASDLRLPRRPFRVVANPPFTITAALLKRLVGRGSRLVQADLLVPRHVAARWVGGRAPGPSVPFRASMHPIPRRALRPAPPSDVAVLRLCREHLGPSEVARSGAKLPKTPGEGSGVRG